MAIVTRYERLHAETVPLRTKRSLCTMLPSFAVAFGLVAIIYRSLSLFWILLAGLITVAVISRIFHHLWMFLSDTYKHWDDRLQYLNSEICQLQAKVTDIFDTYPHRRKGEQFKKAYDLAGRKIKDLEEALAVGMYLEAREVFVTVFLRKGIAVRVTASIGSPYRCSAADNPAQWSHHIVRLRCDEIRQYHNHPHHNGRTAPSPADHGSSKQFVALLGNHGKKIRSFIIYWNPIREWKIMEYDEGGRYWVHFEFDVATYQSELKINGNSHHILSH